MNMVSRRRFLSKSTLTVFSWPLIWVNSSSKEPSCVYKEPGTNILGRVLFDETPTFSNPDEKSTQNKSRDFNDILTLSQPINGYTQLSKKEIWYSIDDHAYIQSKNIQLVNNILNEPHENISINGQLAEITVPFSEAWPKDKQNSYSNQLFFYGSTHWVYGLGKDIENNLYYLVVEDRWGESFYVNAAHLRIIEDHELDPSAPEIEPDKKSILVDTKSQLLIAYEDKTPVMISAISSGIFAENANLITPPGNYTINYKRPSRHMVHSDKVGINDHELYGVPWVTYFTNTGIAFHGTYWHNNYSQPHSHGCVNMPIHAARWIYLWTDPVVPPREKKYVSRYGTRVEVI